METTAAEPGQGWLCMCLCPGGLKNKEEARRASRPWEQREAAAVRMSQAVSVSLGTGKRAGWAVLVSLLSALCRCCLRVTVHVGLQQPPLSKEQAPKLPAKAQAMFYHNFCQRFVFHLFGVQQQEQGRKLPPPLEKLTLDPKQRVGRGGIHPLWFAFLCL